MDIQQLKKYWEVNGEQLYTYSPSQVDKTKVNYESFIFLTTCGLPSDAAPFLSFGELQEDKLRTPNEVFKIDFEGLSDYLMFGSNGSGDPVCLDTTKHSQIVYLNHDNYFERIFINESILQFAVCLTMYRDFILSLVDQTSDDFGRRKFLDTEFEQLKSDFKNIDSSSLSDNSFWAAELDSLLWERDNE
ncbi:MAG: SUKH-4 family immunity protein [Bacteroidia bacterium]